MGRGITLLGPPPRPERTVAVAEAATPVASPAAEGRRGGRQCSLRSTLAFSPSVSLYLLGQKVAVGFLFLFFSFFNVCLK